MPEYPKYGFLPRGLQAGFPAGLSATGSGNLQLWPPESASMGQARRSSSAILAEYPGWVTALGASRR